jgi:TPR repeat protein
VGSHGWGIPSNPPLAVTYLSLAARNSAAIESAALDAGLKKGGAAKGELVLAIFELANCYRMGLGVDKDPVAARRYFETAARLGDVDAMEQTARCYEDGIGGKKDKFMAAKFYRLAEEGGHKIVGNSW